MFGARRIRSEVAGLVLALVSAGCFAPGVASAQTPQAPVNLQFYMGSSAPMQVEAEPWAAVYIDGRQASLADLRPGLVVNIAVDSLGRAVEILASDRTVTGTVGSVRVASSGQLYVVIGGRPYEARLTSSVVAQGGSVIGGLVENQGLLSGNVVTAYLGPDGRVGYVDVQ